MASEYTPDIEATLRARPLSADFTTLPTQETSMLYSFLPAAVKSRLPRIPSIRRSASMYSLNLTSRRKPSSSRPSTGSSTATGSGARTPEMGYNAMVLRGDEVEGYFTESDEEGVTQREIRERQLLELAECKSGIVWKFANQGLNLLHLAATESTSLLRDPAYGNATFARQLYIHSITYLLRGLPSDLTQEEALSLRSALPSGVAEPTPLELSALQASHTSTPPQAQEPSLLHRALASTIVQLFVLIQFLLPYIKALLSSAYTYDRQHKVTERVFNQSIETLDGLGKRGVEVSEKVCGMGDGRVGEVLGQTARWVVRGVAGGVHEGLGEGMVILGAVGRR